MSDLSVVIILGITLIILIFLSAFFSASETSYTSVTNFKHETHYKKKKKNWIFKINTKLLNNYSMTLSTILIANTLVNVAASTLAGLFFSNILTMHHVGNAESIATGMATGILTFLILLFGEFLPKAFARKFSLTYMKIVAPGIYFFYILFYPINWILNKIIKNENTKSATEQEIDTLIDIVSTEGVLENSEASLVSNSLKFDETKISSVMTKIDDVIFGTPNLGKDRLLNLFITTGFSRLPIKKNKKIVGFVDIKSVASYFLKDKKKFVINDILKPIIKVSQYQSLDSVFREMQISQVHMALVKKNKSSSQILGLVTMEDIIEELVGEIHDEHDDKNPVTKINDFTWKVVYDYDANKFIREEIKLPIEIDKNINIKEWLKKEFDVERFSDGEKFSNDTFTVLSRLEERKLYFIFEKQVTKF